MALTDGPSFDLVVGIGPLEGLEAWRKLHSRWDPSISGRSRTLLREILAPAWCNLDGLLSVVERLET